MKNTLPALMLDGYKTDHRRQYPDGTELVFSNLTARGSRVEGVDHVILFGLQYFIKKYLIDDWHDNFFSRPIDEVITEFSRRINNYLGPDNQVGTDHIAALHNLGYLPMKIVALPEGTHVPIRVPMLAMWNTHKDFGWLTNSLETILSTSIWLPCTSATTAAQYRVLLERWAKSTDRENMEFVPWQGHDFSFRGHTSFESAAISGAAHLTSFTGTDTIPAIDLLEEAYGANSDTELVGGSVAATEHSVMCMGGEDGEIETFKRLIKEVYPAGIVSIVSDTWDFWEVVDPNNGFLSILKDDIMARNGKVVIRPDSGDPVRIICGWTEEELAAHNAQLPPADRINPNELETKGMIECLWETFGGTINDQGFKVLDPHIGAIYGDSITLQRAQKICQILAAKGYASTNLVYGIGSFTYQGAITPTAIVTRDTYAFAVKSTYGEVNGIGVNIFKDPKTDDGTKKSARGLTSVHLMDGEYVLKDEGTWHDVENCAFETVFEDGVDYNFQNLKDIRAQVRATQPPVG